MAEPRAEPNECVIYTEGFKNRIQGNVVLPHQAFGQMTLVDHLNHYDEVTLERFQCYRREGLDFVPEKNTEYMDTNFIAHVPTSAISLIHGYVQYGPLSKLDDDRLRSLGYQEIPAFLYYTIDPTQPNELIYGRILGKVLKGYSDPAKAYNDALHSYLKTRLRFIALRDPSNVLLHLFFKQEDWQGRKDHAQQPCSIVLNRRLISFFGIQKTSKPA